MNSRRIKSAIFLSLSLAWACILAGCAFYGPAYEPYQSGDYYDQYSPAYDYYPWQAGYPYAGGGYGYPAVIVPSIRFGVSGGSGGVGVGTSFGW